VRLVVTGGASAWLESEIESVERDGQAIVANLVTREPKSDDVKWRTRLTFASADDGLRLVRADSIGGETYWTVAFADYRPGGDRVIPFSITERRGPLAELALPDKQATQTRVEAYRVGSITSGISGEVRRDFAKPPLSERDESGHPQDRPTYAEITPSGRRAFLPTGSE
jgi:hypothetical protein